MQEQPPHTEDVRGEENTTDKGESSDSEDEGSSSYESDSDTDTSTEIVRPEVTLTMSRDRRATAGKRWVGWLRMCWVVHRETVAGRWDVYYS